MDRRLTLKSEPKVELNWKAVGKRRIIVVMQSRASKLGDDEDEELEEFMEVLGVVELIGTDCCSCFSSWKGFRERGGLVLDAHPISL